MLEPDWYLREWLRYFGKRQASLVNELGWTKNRASIVWHSRQPYRRDLVNEIARWLELKPYELLMEPREAAALKRLRESAAQIVAEDDTPFEPAPAAATPRGKIRKAG
jgi:hypothetical protein